MQLPDFRHLLKRFILEVVPLILILLLGHWVWTMVFDTAVVHYLDLGSWKHKCGWLGNGNLNIFGFIFSFQLEGYSDYSFYYVHWGHNYLRGVLPYGPEFGIIEIDGIENENGAYMFPPFSALLYALGISLNADNTGIGLIFAILGFLTAFPVYGIARNLSNNHRVGEAAALTYLLSPNVLYHVTYIWMNPAPFMFFFFAGFFMLLKNRKYIGTLLIVTAALFKQTAWFLGIPLITLLLIRPQASKSKDDGTKEVNDEEKPKKRSIVPKWLTDSFNILTFLKGAIVAVLYAGAVMLPFYLAQPAMISHLALAAGGFPLESFTEPPHYGQPIRFQVLPVIAGMPELAQLLDWLIYSTFPLWIGVMTFAGLMLIELRQNERPKYYNRRILFLTMMMMLWVHIFGPRGVFKYYFVFFAPFFSIFSSASMVSSEEEEVSFSISMLIMPFLMSVLILFPNRLVYLFGVILIFVGYAVASQIGKFWHLVTYPVRELFGFVRGYIPLSWTMLWESIRGQDLKSSTD